MTQNHVYTSAGIIKKAFLKKSPKWGSHFHHQRSIISWEANDRTFGDNSNLKKFNATNVNIWFQISNAWITNPRRGKQQ